MWRFARHKVSRHKNPRTRKRERHCTSFPYGMQQEKICAQALVVLVRGLVRCLVRTLVRALVRKDVAPHKGRPCAPDPVLHKACSLCAVLCGHRAAQGSTLCAGGDRSTRLSARILANRHMYV